MAGFEGTKWASKQMRFKLKDKSYEVMNNDAKVYAVSRSIHYGLFLAFEGIRFYCKKTNDGKTKINFLNLHKNFERFQRSMSFNLNKSQQKIVPSVKKIEEILIRFLQEPDMKDFCTSMAKDGAQGYLRPFTFDESQSIGVTFPDDPSIRAVVCQYDRYLGEPFSGVVIPNLVRAIGINGTGHLKLGINYLISVKAVDAAKQIDPNAVAALFLDDRPYEELESRKVTEWDSSCCLFALKNGTIVKISENPLILPSVTIQGICTILRNWDIKVEERHITYGEIIERSKNDEIVAICSIGTAGILNRARGLILTDMDGNRIGEQKADQDHELFKKLGEARTYYWDIYREKVDAFPGMKLNSFIL